MNIASLILGIIMGVVGYHLARKLTKKKEKFHMIYNGQYYSFDTEQEAMEFIMDAIKSQEEIKSLINTLGIKTQSDIDEDEDEGGEYHQK